MFLGAWILGLVQLILSFFYTLYIESMFGVTKFVNNALLTMKNENSKVIIKSDNVTLFHTTVTTDYGRYRFKRNCAGNHR